MRLREAKSIIICAIQGTKVSASEVDEACKTVRETVLGKKGKSGAYFSQNPLKSALIELNAMDQISNKQLSELFLIWGRPLSRKVRGAPHYEIAGREAPKKTANPKHKKSTWQKRREQHKRRHGK